MHFYPSHNKRFSLLLLYYDAVWIGKTWVHKLENVVHSTVLHSNSIQSEAMHNLSAHQIPQYYWLQQVSTIASTALIITYTLKTNTYKNNEKLLTEPNISLNKRVIVGINLLSKSYAPVWTGYIQSAVRSNFWSELLGEVNSILFHAKLTKILTWSVDLITLSVKH